MTQFCRTKTRNWAEIIGWSRNHYDRWRWNSGTGRGYERWIKGLKSDDAIFWAGFSLHFQHPEAPGKAPYCDAVFSLWNTTLFLWTVVSDEKNRPFYLYNGQPALFSTPVFIGFDNYQNIYTENSWFPPYLQLENCISIEKRGRRGASWPGDREIPEGLSLWKMHRYWV